MTAADEGPAEGPDASAGENSDESSLLRRRFRDANAALDAASTDSFEKFLKPFAATFAELHRVQLVELPVEQAVPELDDLDVQARVLAADVLRSLADGSASRVLYAVVRLGIQATDNIPAVGRTAAEAWAKGVEMSRLALPRAGAVFHQTNRNLAKNKKLFILGTLSAMAVAGGVWIWRDEMVEKEARLEEEHREKLRVVEQRRSDMLSLLDLERVRYASERAEEAAATLTQLVDLGLNRLPALQALVAASADYDTYEKADRLLVAELAGLAHTIAAVIGTAVAEPASPDPEDQQFPVLEAARRVVSRYGRQQSPGSDAAPALSWALGQVNTTQQREQLAYLTQQSEFVERLARRCGASRQRIKEGFHFEWLHELGFNLDAIAKDSANRAYVTEWLGRPADPADVVVNDSEGRVVLEAQMKVVESNSKRVGPANGLIDRKYEEKALVIPADHLDPTQAFLDKLGDRPPANVNRERYEDARGRLSDVLAHEGIASDPITTGQLTEAANDPLGHLRRVADNIELQRAVNAAVAAGGTAMVTSLATDLVTHLYAERTFEGFNWAQASVGTARTSAATMAAAAAGTYMRAAGERAVAGGSTSSIHASWAHGDHGPAITQAAVDIAGIVHGLATDRLTPAEASEATAEALVRSAITWVCTAAVRNTIGDAEVAALVGGIVGQHSSKLVVYGVRVAILGRDPDPRWDEAYATLLADNAALESACEAEREELVSLGQEHRVGFTEYVIPALEHLTATSGASAGAQTGPGGNAESDPAEPVDPDAQLLALAAITNHFAATPLYDSLEAFDAFMSDPDSVLVLKNARA